MIPDLRIFFFACDTCHCINQHTVCIWSLKWVDVIGGTHGILYHAGFPFLLLLLLRPVEHLACVHFNDMTVCMNQCRKLCTNMNTKCKMDLCQVNWSWKYLVDRREKFKEHKKTQKKSLKQYNNKIKTYYTTCSFLICYYYYVHKQFHWLNC